MTRSFGNRIATNDYWINRRTESIVNGKGKHMEHEFLNFIAEVMEEDSVTMDLPYKEGKWDSLMMLTLVMELEAEYGVSIPMEKLGNVNTLADLYEFVK